jgi:hypothetical protein
MFEVDASLQSDSLAFFSDRPIYFYNNLDDLYSEKWLLNAVNVMNTLISTIFADFRRENFNFSQKNNVIIPLLNTLVMCQKVQIFSNFFANML